MNRRAAGWRTLLAALIALGHAATAMAEGIGARAGEHPGFGRLVFDLPPGAEASATQTGDRVLVRFPGRAPGEGLEGDPPAARNLRSAETVAGGVALTAAHGARVKVTRLEGRLVIDLLDPPRPPPSPPVSQSKPRPSPPVPATTSAGRPPLLLPARGVPPVASPPLVAGVAPMPDTPRSEPPPVVADPGPAAPAPATPGLAAEPRPPPSPLPDTVPARAPVPVPLATQAPLALVATNSDAGLSFPFSPTTGAAAFRRGGEAFVVFDERRPIDLSGVRDAPACAGAAVQVLADATLLRLPVAADSGLMLKHEGAAWVVSFGHAPADGFVPSRVADGVLLSTDQAGRVVAVPDPDGGGTLLVGTLRRPGLAVLQTRRATEFILWPTWVGLAVEPVRDALQMRAEDGGFRLTTGGGRDLALSADFVPGAPETGGRLTRSFDLPRLPPAALFRRLQDAERLAADAPPRGRSDRLAALAQALLALGMGAEAQGVAALAMHEDPHAAQDANLAAIAAIGALLAGRPGESDALGDDRLPDTDEVAFWRGLRASLLAQREGLPGLARGAKLLPAYPAPLRDRLLGVVGETLAEQGPRPAAAALLAALPEEPRLALARALLAEAEARAGGAPQPALAQLASVAAGADRRMRAIAASHAAELRLAGGLASREETAAALERLLYAWRDDRREIALRERIAELRGAEGARSSIALLRDTAATWPAEAARLKPQMAALLTAAVRTDRTNSGARMPPIDVVALIDENADLVPGGEEGAAVAGLLADRLAALDLPVRAAAVLEKLAARAPAGAPRAVLGERLAEQRLARDEFTAAVAALDASEAPDLPDALRGSRDLTRARAQAGLGQRAAALTTLATVDADEGRLLRAALNEADADWSGAVRALAPLLAAIPPDGPLAPGQSRLVLRAASDAAQAGDEATTAQLRTSFLARFADADAARLFGLLAAAPVRGTADLPRAGREMAFARNLPGQLEAATSPIAQRDVPR